MTPCPQQGREALRSLGPLGQVPEGIVEVVPRMDLRAAPMNRAAIGTAWRSPLKIQETSPGSIPAFVPSELDTSPLSCRRIA